MCARAMWLCALLGFAGMRDNTARAGAAADGSATGTGTAPPAPQLLEPPTWTTVRAPRVKLRVHVEGETGGVYDVRFYGRQMAGLRPPSFAIVALPDTQYYSERYPELFNAQTEWIVAQRTQLNIAYVAHLGDIVELCVDLAQWENANQAMSVLDTVPALAYGLAVGNHDQVPMGNPRGTAIYNTYFPYTRYEGVVDWYGGHHGTDNDNHYVLFSALGLDFIAIHLEFDSLTYQQALIWAGALLDVHVNRRAIVVAHNLLIPGEDPPVWSAQGAATYEALKNHPNLFLMLCGHNFGEVRRTDEYNGNVVYTLMSNYQTRPNGGDGWLRIMHFTPESNRIFVQTYSPVLGRYETDSDSQFVLPYPMDVLSYVELGAVSGVPGGSDVELEWPGLPAGARFQWYAVVSDGTEATASDVWTFLTTWPLGDLDCDGALDFGDINPFVQYLADPAGWQARYPDCSAENGDINQDGEYPSFGDINPFVALLAAQGAK